MAGGRERGREVSFNLSRKSILLTSQHSPPFKGRRKRKTKTTRTTEMKMRERTRRKTAGRGRKKGRGSEGGKMERQELHRIT